VNRSLPVFELERFFNGKVLPHFFKALWANAFDCAQGFFVAKRGNRKDQRQGKKRESIAE
jgi:hypothetical protein